MSCILILSSLNINTITVNRAFAAKGLYIIRGLDAEDAAHRRPLGAEQRPEDRRA